MSSLTSLNKQREQLTAQLVVLNKELSTKKSWGGKRKAKKAIRQVEGQIKDIDKQIKKLERIDNQEIRANADLELAKLGKTGNRAAIVGSISEGASSLGQSAFGQFGIFGQKGVFSQDRASVMQQKQRGAAGMPDGDPQNNKNLMIIIVAAVVGLMLMLKK